MLYKVKYAPGPSRKEGIYIIELPEIEDSLYSLYQAAFNQLVDKSRGAVISSYELAKPDGLSIIDEALDEKIPKEVDVFILRSVYMHTEKEVVDVPLSRLSVASHSTSPFGFELAIEKRIGVLLACKGADLNSSKTQSSKTSTSGSRLMESSIVPINDDAACLRGFPVSSTAVQQLSAIAWSKIKELLETDALKLPKPGDDEIAIVHVFIRSLLNIVRCCASELKLPVNRLFYAYDAADHDGRTPDWVLSRPKEQKLFPWNKLLFIEAKQVQTLHESGSRKGTIAKSEDVLLREAMAQCLYHITRRHRDTGRSTMHGVGLAWNTVVMCTADYRRRDGLWIAAIRRNGATPCGISNHISVLGEGGFGIVFAVDRTLGGINEQYALKVMRRGGDEENTWLNREAQVLEQLNSQNIPRVPKLHRVSDSPNPRFLLMTPVGVPFTLYREACGDPRAVADQALVKLFETLSSAHRANIMHGDVRPSNVVMLCDEPYLVDWGLGTVGPGGAHSRRDLFGVQEFMAAEKLLWKLKSSRTSWKLSASHDLQALLFTYVAMRDPDCDVPWRVDDQVHGEDAIIHAMIAKRREWFLNSASELCDFAKNTPELKNEIEIIVSNVPL
eukprot:gene27389-33080_t